MAAGAGHFVGQHNDGITDPDFGMSDLSPRRLHAHDFLCTERTFVEVDRTRRIVGCQIRGRGVETCGYGFGLWHWIALLVFDFGNGFQSTAASPENAVTKHPLVGPWRRDP